MPARDLPGLALKAGWNLGESGWNVGMDANLGKLSTYVALSAADIVDALPATPPDGVIYILSGAAASNPNQIAARDAGAWVYYLPRPGLQAWVQAFGSCFRFDGTGWVMSDVGDGSLVSIPAVGTFEVPGIKPSTREIVVDFWELSNVSPDAIVVSLGTSVGLVQTGYTGAGSRIGAGGTDVVASPSGLLLNANLAGSAVSGQMVFRLIDPATDKWNMTAVASVDDGSASLIAQATISLPLVCDRIGFVAESGSFDGGSINVRERV